MLKIKLSQITKDDKLTFACTDLGAFNDIGKNNFKNKGISGIVIMEDRLPDFFISYNEYEANKDTTLNRHGPKRFLRTQFHLKQLVDELHSQRIKVYFGFLGQLFDPHKKYCLPWIDNHLELWSLNKENEQNSDMDPLAELKPENIDFSQFIVNQFVKLQRDFNFDGLFLGDGLNGYRLFTDPNKYEDKESSKDKWTEFYKTIADGVHELDCKLLAYDCLGFDPQRAILHGADYLAQAQSGLDYLFVQTYPTAWGKKWLKNFSGFDFKSCYNNLKSIKEKLAETNCKVCYTLEMGDSVEGWKPNYCTTKKQLNKFREFSDGKLIVWANHLFG